MSMDTNLNVFFRFALCFIPGCGIVAGEILESLWSSLNSISPTVRTATLLHQAKMLDDHATDSNHKKMLGMTLSLCSNHREALEMSTHMTKYYMELTRTIGQQAVQQWEDEVSAAEAQRLADVKVMDVYATRAVNEVTPLGSAGSALTTHSATVTQLATVTRLATAVASASTSVPSAIEQWVEFAIFIEEKQ